MKCFNLLSLFILLNISFTYAITCDEAKSLLNIEYEGNCCDLPQINCDETNENILSIETLIDEDDYENNRNLYRRKGGGGGRGGGGRFGGGGRSGGRSGSSKSSKSGGGGGFFYHSSGASSIHSIKINSFQWTFMIILSLLSILVVKLI